MKVYVHLLTWNGIRYLPQLFKSLDEQCFQDFHLRIFDNGSQDGTYEYLREHRPHDLVGRSMKNLLFVGGHHAIMKATLEKLDSDPEGTLIILLNQDIILDKDAFRRLVDAFVQNPTLASAQPKLLRAFGEPTEDEVLSEITQSDIIDSTGLCLHKDWRFYDRGEGVVDQGQYDGSRDILGPNGAVPTYRLSAILDVALEEGEIFDVAYDMYREDVDLALRLRRAGYASAFVPEAVAYHYRGMYGGEKLSLWQRFKNRRRQRPLGSALSLRNELHTFLKHYSFLDYMRHFFRITWSLGGRIVYGFFFESLTRKYLLQLFGELPSILDKRKKIREKSTIPVRALAEYVEY